MARKLLRPAGGVYLQAKGEPMRWICSLLALMMLCCRPARRRPPNNPIAWTARPPGHRHHIDGHGPFIFLIDTASNRSLIFEHVRKKLGLTRSQPGRLMVYGINDVAEAMPVKPGELRSRAKRCAASPWAYCPTPRRRPDGILGVDILSRYLVVLDRAAMRLKLLPPGGAVPSAYAGWTKVELMPQP